MNLKKNNMFSRTNYVKPEILKVTLDNDISLQLASDQPPSFDNENISYMQESFKNMPFAEFKG